LVTGFAGGVIAAMASLNIGAGCGPACSSTPFTTIATVASTATPKHRVAAAPAQTRKRREARRVAVALAF